MTPESLTLASTAFVLGAVHTALGPDHYLPFVALARARTWTLRRAVAVALACGVAHVGSSALLGLVGFVGGRSVAELVAFDTARAPLAGWLLFGVGLAYTVWGLRRAVKGHRHDHLHVHADGTVHRHPHDHHGDHAHLHADPGGATTPAAWGLFLFFVFGPCEPLIPLFIYPAASGGSPFEVLAVLAAFSVATLGTMAVLVAIGYHAAGRLARRSPMALARWSHALAGATLAVCGLLVNAGW